METVPEGNQLGGSLDGAVTALKVESVRERMACLPQLVGLDCVLLEHAIYDSLRALSPEYGGGFWEYYRLSNGGFYMAPEHAASFRILCEGNGFTGTVSAQAAGIIACAMAYSHLSFRAHGERFAHAYEKLSEFICLHPEARAIRAALD